MFSIPFVSHLCHWLNTLLLLERTPYKNVEIRTSFSYRNICEGGRLYPRYSLFCSALCTVTRWDSQIWFQLSNDVFVFFSCGYKSATDRLIWSLCTRRRVPNRSTGEARGNIHRIKKSSRRVFNVPSVWSGLCFWKWNPSNWSTASGASLTVVFWIPMLNWCAQ